MLGSRVILDNQSQASNKTRKNTSTNIIQRTDTSGQLLYCMNFNNRGYEKPPYSFDCCKAKAHRLCLKRAVRLLAVDTKSWKFGSMHQCFLAVVLFSLTPCLHLRCIPSSEPGCISHLTPWYSTYICTIATPTPVCVLRVEDSLNDNLFYKSMQHKTGKTFIGLHVCWFTSPCLPLYLLVQGQCFPRDVCLCYVSVVSFDLPCRVAGGCLSLCLCACSVCVE